MRKIKRWRYYCDYCKKAGGSAYHIKKHERGCTANPNRVCGYCEASGDEQVDINVLTNVLKQHAESCNPATSDLWIPAIDKLREMTGNCPACILAAIRQSKLFGHNKGQYEEFNLYNFREEVGLFWAEINNNQLLAEHHY